MADETPVGDPYDPGDTSQDLSREQPRNPNGTFAPTTPPSPHPSYLTRLARDFGFSDEEMATMPSEALGTSIYRLQKAQQASEARLASARDLDRQPPAAPVPVAPPAEPDISLGFDEAAFAPEIVQHLKAQKREALATKKALEDKLAELEKRDQQREARTFGDRIDLAFEALGKDYQKLFGTGSIDELPEGAPQRTRRQLAYAAAGVTPQDSARTIAAKLQKAADQAFKDLVSAPAPAANDPGAYVPDNKDVKTWNNGAVARPQGRKNSPLPPGEERALANLRARLQEQEIGTEAGDAEVYDGLPN